HQPLILSARSNELVRLNLSPGRVKETEASLHIRPLSGAGGVSFSPGTRYSLQ
ncbi:hypothetical protein DNTS_028508, partial [Danionella cerebrum]